MRTTEQALRPSPGDEPQRFATSNRAVRSGVLAVGFIICLFWSNSHAAQTPDATSLEYRMKAAYLMKFINFVTWPEAAFVESGGTIVVGVVGDSPILKSLSGIQGRHFKGRSLLVRQFKRPADITFAHILFIPEAQKNQIPSILSSVKNKHTLTVGESERFISNKGMVSIYPVSNQILFKIDEEKARNAGLTIAPELLALSQ